MDGTNLSVDLGTKKQTHTVAGSESYHGVAGQTVNTQRGNDNFHALSTGELQSRLNIQDPSSQKAPSSLSALPKTASGDSTSQRAVCPAPVVERSHKTNRFPNNQVRQRPTKSWAKVHFWHSGQVGHKKRTVRQSRGVQKPVRTRTMPEAIRIQVPDDESDTDSVQNGLCHISSIPTWKQIGNKTLSFRQSASLIPFRQTSRVHRSHCHPMFALHRNRTEGSLRKPLPRQIRSCRTSRPRPSLPDLRTEDQEPQMMEAAAPNNASGSTLNLDCLDQFVPLPNQPKSPVPTLHDPIKDKAFSEECQELIIRLGRSWDASPANDGFHSTKDGLVSSQDVDEEANQTKANLARPQRPSVPPVPPERTSSKGGPKLATLVHLSRPSCISLFNGLKMADIVESTSTRSSDVLHWARPTDILKTTSDLGRSNRTGLKHFRSTDTIAIIEAQVQDAPEAPIMLRIKKEPNGKPSSVRSSTPSGEPPEKPLPALPIESTDTDGQEGQLVPVKLAEASTIRAVVDTDDGLVRRGHGESAPLLVPCADSMALMKAKSKPDSSPTSVYSQHPSWTAPQLRKAVLKSNAATNEIKNVVRPSTRAAESVPSLTRPEHQKDSTCNADELDQFPAVPHSRSTSGEGLSPRSSPKKKHSRSTSKLDSMLHGAISLAKKGGDFVNHQKTPSRLSEMLTKSSIMVIVDTDPGQAYGFRAGTISPVSRHPLSCANSPKRLTLATSQAPPEIEVSAVHVKPDASSSIDEDSFRGFNRPKSNFCSRVHQETSKRPLNRTSSHAHKTSRGRIIIEASDEEGDITPLVRSPVPRTLSSSRHTRQRSSRGSSISTSLFSFSEEKQRWKEFRQNAKEEYEEWLQLRNTMRQDLSGLFKDLEKTTVVLGRMAHAGRSFAPLDSDDADECESLISRPSTRSHGYSLSSTTSRGGKYRPRDNGKSRSNSSLVDSPLKAPTLEGFDRKKPRAPRAQRPISGNSANTANDTVTDSDGSAMLSSSSKEGKLRKKSSGDSLTDPLDYNCEPNYPRAYSKRQGEQKLGPVDQTVIKAADMSAIRRAAKHDPDQERPLAPHRHAARSTASTPTGTKLSTEYETRMLRRPPSPKPDSSPAQFRRWQPGTPSSSDDRMVQEPRYLDMNHAPQISSDEMDRALDMFKVLL